MKPNMRMIQEALQDVLGLADLPKRIECFDISHIQGAETVASMVVWEDGAMKKSDYRNLLSSLSKESTISHPCERSSLAAINACEMTRNRSLA